MSYSTAMETLLLMMLTLGIMGTWDGVVRRHIRYSLDVAQINIIFGGVRAVVVGLMCMAIAAFAVMRGVQGIAHIAKTCHNEAACTLQHAVLAPLLDWRAAFVILICCVLFFSWLSGALDMQGPFRQRLLASGVWYREQDLVPLVSKRLHEEGMPQVRLDVIVGIARLVWQNAPALAHESSNRRNKAPLGYQRTLARQAAKREHISESVAQIVVTTVAEYYIEKHEQAAAVWPWRRKVLGH